MFCVTGTGCLTLDVRRHSHIMQLISTLGAVVGTLAGFVIGLCYGFGVMLSVAIGAGGYCVGGIVGFTCVSLNSWYMNHHKH